MPTPPASPAFATPAHPHKLPILARWTIVLLICVQATLCWLARERSLRGDVDLRAFYAAGVTVRQGHASRLYDPAEITAVQAKLFGTSGRTLPFLYPAFAALTFAALSPLPYTLVFRLVLIANLCFLLLTARLLSPRTARTGLTTGWLFALFLCFLPVSIALMQGQISCALLLVFATAHVLAERGRGISAGLALSLGLAKIQLVLPVILLYVLWRRWGVLRGFLTGTLLLTGTSLALTGVHGATAYVKCLGHVGAGMLLDPNAAQLSFGMQAAAEPNLHGLFTLLAGPGAMSGLLTFGASALLLFLARQRGRLELVALPFGMLVSYHMQPYDLTMLLLPLALLPEALRKQPPSRRRLAVWLAGTSLLLLTAPIGAYLLATHRTTWFVLAVCGVLLACTDERPAARGHSSMRNKKAAAGLLAESS